MTAPTYPTDAACADSAIDFYPSEAPGRGDPWAAPRAICGGCEVAAACLAGAMTRREAWGMWGGMTPAERDALINEQERAARRERRARAKRGETVKGRPGPVPAPIAHGTYGGAVAHRRRKVPTCDACHKAERTYRNDYRAARQAAS